MDDAKQRDLVILAIVVSRRDGTREVKTPRPLENMDAAFEAIAQISLVR